MGAAFKLEEKDGVSIIKCPKVIELTTELEDGIKQWQESVANVHVVDFAGVVEFKERAYRPFILFNQAIKAHGKKLFAINASNSLATQLAQGGLTSIFQPVKDIQEAKSKSGARNTEPAHGRSSVDVKFLNAFITATETVLNTQCGIKIDSGKPYIKKASDNLPMQIAGVISLSNPAFTGSISLCFQYEVFLNIYESMIGERHETITPEIEDAAGELLNMVFGQAKTELNDHLGYTLEKALPTIMVGEKLTVRQQSQSPVMILPFSSSAGAFHIEVVVEKQ